MGGMKKKGPAQRSPKKSRSRNQRLRPERHSAKRTSNSFLPCEQDFAFNDDW